MIYNNKVRRSASSKDRPMRGRCRISKGLVQLLRLERRRKKAEKETGRKTRGGNASERASGRAVNDGQEGRGARAEGVGVV